jgi:hypothetical protein
MDLSKILAISGKPGLYKLIAQSKSGLIVESLIDNKRFPTHLTDKVNKLDDITVYSTDKDMPLKDVMLSIFKKENGGPAVDTKADDKTLKAYFESALPTYDKERVYISDIKKILNWYNVLQKLELITPDEEEKKEEKEEEKEEEKKEEKENI